MKRAGHAFRNKATDIRSSTRQAVASKLRRLAVIDTSMRYGAVGIERLNPP
jgi:hypothetical protein